MVRASTTKHNSGCYKAQTAGNFLSCKYHANATIAGTSDYNYYGHCHYHYHYYHYDYYYDC